ncbi:MAG: hypothetical protein Q8R92_17005 [Deltaproteobacteria bacterium]|nr:hypothetical protein [Deltaproteobacteria bacterium]
MKFIDDWREELNKAWSVKLAILASALGIADQLLPALSGLVPPIAYALLSASIIFAKVVWQK